MGTCFGKTGGPEAQLPATQLAQPDSRAPPPAGRLPAVAEPPGSTAPRNGGPADSVAELRSAQQPTSPSTTITERILPVLYNHLQNSIHALDLAASSVAESMSDVPPELREDLSDIVTATRNTHILVNDLLTISRLKQGTLAPMPEVVCIRQKLKDAASRARSAVRVPISVSCSPDVPSLLCVDAALLSHILADALTLSARYCDTGGSIHVLMYRASSSASASAASVGATGGAAATPMLGTAAAAGGPVDRRLVVEVMDTGAGLGGVSGADMLRALRGGQQVKGARAQRMSVFLALAHVLAETMGGETDVVEWRDASARVVRFSMTCPFTLPSEAERARATEELLDVLAEEGADMTPLPLPQPFAAASGFAAGGAGSVPAPAAPLAGAKETGAAVPARQPSTQGGAAGAGTAATVEALPPMPATAAGAETVASGGAGARRGGRRAVVGLDGQPLSMHVLLVDDMGVIRRQGEAFLEQLGCTCITLEDGDEVESALRNARRPFDAIVLDIVMSRSDGAQVCRNLREAFNVRCPIIAMTGQTSSKDLQRYYAMGFDVVLPKPFTRDAIGRALVEGRERRGGNARFARMSARVEGGRGGGGIVSGVGASTEPVPTSPAASAPTAQAATDAPAAGYAPQAGAPPASSRASDRATEPAHSGPVAGTGSWSDGPGHSASPASTTGAAASATAWASGGSRAQSASGVRVQVSSAAPASQPVLLGRVESSATAKTPVALSSAAAVTAGTAPGATIQYAAVPGAVNISQAE